MEPLFDKSKLEIRVGDANGRSLHASTTFSRGEEIMSLPFAAYVVTDDSHDSVCAFCLHQSESSQLLRCSACRYVRYCNSQCQKLDWKQQHKLVCNWLKELPPGHESHDVTQAHLLKSVVLQRKQNSPQWDLYDTLESQGGPKEETLLPIANLAKEKDSLRELVRFSRNNFGMQDTTFKLLGEGVSPVSALLNHQCHSSNTVFHTRIEKHKAPRHVLMSVQEIKIGDALVHSYMQLREGVNERQKTIFNVYHFNCICKVCVEPVERVESLLTPVFDEKLFNHSSLLLRQSFAEDDFGKSVELAKSALALRLKSLEFHDYHPLVTECRQELVNVLILASSMLNDPRLVNEAANELLVIIRALSELLGPFHPLVGTQLFLLGDLRQNLQDHQSAYTVLSTCYGRTHPLCQQLEILMKQ